jgi:flagellar biogenesis protein FliO
MDEATLVFRFVAALAALAGILGGAALVVRALRGRLPALGGGRLLAVRESVALTHGAALHLVRIGERCAVVGTAPGSISLIADFPGAPAEGPIARSAKNERR